MAEQSWTDIALTPNLPGRAVPGDRLIALAGWIQRVAPRGKGYFPRALGRLAVPEGPRKRLYLETRHGVRMLMPPQALDVYATMLANGRSWDYHDFELCLGLAPEGCVFYDLGANVGYESLELARVRGPGTRVFSFEPLDALAQSIADSAALNDLEVASFSVLVGDRDEETPFFTPTTGSTLIGSAVSNSPGQSSVESTKQMVSLDRLVYQAGMAPPDAMKVDVEAAEHLVFAGAHRMLREARPHIFMEYFSDFDEGGKTRAAVESLMADTGVYGLYGYPRLHFQDRFPTRLFPLTEDAQWDLVHGLVLRNTERPLADATIFD